MLFKLVSITQFGVIPPTCPFRRDGSHGILKLFMTHLMGHIVYLDVHVCTYASHVTYCIKSNLHSEITALGVDEQERTKFDSTRL